MLPVNRSVPCSNAVSLPHPQISEASRSCELTRWSETGGSDPKDPPWPLCPPCAYLPCTSQWRNVSLDQSEPRSFSKWLGESFIYLWKSFFWDRRGVSVSVPVSLHKAPKAQTLQIPPFPLLAHISECTQSSSAWPWWRRRKRKRRFLERGVWEDTWIHTASTTWAIYKQDSGWWRNTTDTFTSGFFPLYSSVDYYNSMYINTTWVKLDSAFFLLLLRQYYLLKYLAKTSFCTDGFFFFFLCNIYWNTVNRE